MRKNWWSYQQSPGKPTSLVNGFYKFSVGLLSLFRMEWFSNFFFFQTWILASIEAPNPNTLSNESRDYLVL
jgi:hypothetical protein